MVAVADNEVCPTGQRTNRRRKTLHRLVAVAVSPGELRAGSDFVVRVAGAAHVDLLLVTDGDGTGDSVGMDPYADPDDDLPDPSARVRELVADLGLLHVDVHRLGLPAPPQPHDVDDVVAAISELVGFDPEPGVGCVVPLVRKDGADPADLVVDRAVQRIRAAYRLQLLTYVPQAS